MVLKKIIIFLKMLPESPMGSSQSTIYVPKKTSVEGNGSVDQ